MVCSNQHFNQIFLSDLVLRAHKTLLLGKCIKIRSQIRVAASGRSCLMTSFNNFIITCAVASYVHYMISFDMCQHSCAKFMIWLQMPLIVLEFFTLLLVLHIQHFILVLGLCQFKRSLLILSRNCLTITHVLRRLITSIGCRPWSRKLLCFRKWTDGHLIFCRWLSLIIMLAVPSCSPRWIQQLTGARPWFLWTLCAHIVFRTTIRRVLALTTISGWHSLDYNAVGGFISNTLAYSEHLYMKVPAGYDNDWGTASLCKIPVNVIFFGFALVLGFGLMPVRRTLQVNSRPILLIIGNFSRSTSRNRVLILCQWLWWSL